MMLTNREGKSVNKQELVSEIASCANLTKADSEKALDAVIKGITNALKKGEDVSLVGFGTFRVKQRKARMGRNPRTGEAIQIKAANVVSFKSGKGLKESVQDGGAGLG